MTNEQTADMVAWICCGIAVGGLLLSALIEAAYSKAKSAPRVAAVVYWTAIVIACLGISGCIGGCGVKHSLKEDRLQHEGKRL